MRSISTVKPAAISPKLRALEPLIAVFLTLLIVPSAQAAFSIGTFTVAAKKANGSAETRAGAHPYSLEAGFALDTEAGAQRLRDLTVQMPPGMLINPTAVAECSEAAFHKARSSSKPGSLSGESCPDSSQVGVIEVNVGGTVRYFGLFNLVSPFGRAAAIGASPFGTPVVFTVQVREGDSGLDLRLAGLPQSLDLRSLHLTIWGTPWWGNAKPSETHDPQRGNCLNEETGGSLASTCQVLGPGVQEPESLIKSYITLPTTPCATPPAFQAEATSWQGAQAQATAAIAALINCNKSLSTLTVQLMTDSAASRTGLAFNLDVNDGGGILNPGGIARPAIKTAISSLPEGLTVNPSLGAGLGTCAEADFARETAASEPGTGCPNASKIGTVTVEGALGLAEPLQGSVYLATPYHNPYGSLLSVYMLARSARRGIIVRSRGHLDPDPHSGRILGTFDELPRLLYTHFTLTLREGQRSTLVSPATCGPYISDLQIASWAEPTTFRHETSAFSINHGLSGGACPPGGLAPFAPGLLAGSLNPTAGAHTPFSLRMTRTDADQEITSYSATLPPGLLADLRGIPICPDAAIDAARARTGIHGAQEELDAPSCPAASEIGHTLAGYGVGGTLAWAPGALYLAGPYHGAPISTVAIDSALIGPFDLGVVVVRSAIRVDPLTTQVSIDSAGSDPIPHIIRGIPLHLRDIRVHVDRPDFTRNPTSCNPTQVLSTLTGAAADLFSPADDSTATSTQRYQVLNCTVLPFRPKLKFRFTSGFKRRAFPSLRTELRTNPGEANLHFVSVTLPRTEFIAQEHLRNFCTKAQFAAGACPPDSVYGRARAFTPLLDEPLEGPVYLRSSSGGGLPNMVFALSGRGGVRTEVVGKIDSVHESLRATFTDLPDAPVSKFVMTLYGGKKGLIQNEKNICTFPQFANARLIGQNNTGEAIKPHLETRCPKKKSKRANHRHGDPR
jgi:hypothetical protein